MVGCPTPPLGGGGTNSGSLGFPKFWVGGSRNSPPPPPPADDKHIPGHDDTCVCAAYSPRGSLGRPLRVCDELNNEHFLKRANYSVSALSTKNFFYTVFKLSNKFFTQFCGILDFPLSNKIFCAFAEMKNTEIQKDTCAHPCMYDMKAYMCRMLWPILGGVPPSAVAGR